MDRGDICTCSSASPSDSEAHEGEVASLRQDIAQLERDMATARSTLASLEPLYTCPNCWVIANQHHMPPCETQNCLCLHPRKWELVTTAIQQRCDIQTRYYHPCICICVCFGSPQF